MLGTVGFDPELAWWAFATHVRGVHYRGAEHLTKALSRNKNGVTIEEIQVLCAGIAIKQPVYGAISVREVRTWHRAAVLGNT